MHNSAKMFSEMVQRIVRWCPQKPKYQAKKFEVNSHFEKIMRYDVNGP